jgi:hypothetical protein
MDLREGFGEAIELGSRVSLTRAGSFQHRLCRYISGSDIVSATGRTNSRAPEDLDIAIGLKPYTKLVAFEQPHPSPKCGLAQHIKVYLSKIGYRLQDRPDIFRALIVIMVVNVLNHMVTSSHAEDRVADLQMVGVGEHC